MPMGKDGVRALLRPLADYQPKSVWDGALRSSAVLIPILAKGRGRLIFTMRSKHLKNHASQVSFPGGRIEANESPWEAALREAEEEIGIRKNHVTPMGRLDDVLSPRGFHIRCFVGLLHHFEPVINHDEVERLVEVGLDELFDTRLHSIKKWKGIRDVHYFEFKQGLVWGVTGQITYRLRELLKPLAGTDPN